MDTNAADMNNPTRPAVKMVGVEKWYGDFHALKSIDLTVAPGEKIVVCGPSGSGKSTLIRCINQLETVQKGRIEVDGIELTASSKNVERIRREVGMVFQQFNLFPHMTVLENCMLAPIKVRGATKADMTELHRNLIDGDWVEGEAIANINPQSDTNEVVGHYARATKADAEPRSPRRRRPFPPGRARA
jgi:polar amino acid transport system ATP-binding protein